MTHHIDQGRQTGEYQVDLSNSSSTISRFRPAFIGPFTIANKLSGKTVTKWICKDDTIHILLCSVDRKSKEAEA